MKPEMPAVFTPRQYDATMLLDHFRWIRSRHPEAQLYVLTDMNIPEFPVPVVDCRNTDFFLSFPADAIHGRVFYCIFDSDERAIPILGWIADHGGVFYPVPVIEPAASYLHFHDHARSLLRDEWIAQQREGFAKWDCGPGDMINLIQCIDATRELDGSFVEIGTFRGSSARVALRYMHSIQLRRACYFVDVFTGFNYARATTSADRMWLGTHSTEGMEAVAERLSAYNNPESGPEVRVVRMNVITDPLPPELKQVALANIDVDMLEAVDAALRKVGPLMVKNGIMIIEDPGHTPALIGARIALDRFMKSPAGAAFMPIYMESGQTLLIRTCS